MMTSKMTGFRIALALTCAISLAACSKKNPNSLNAGLNGGAGGDLAAGAAAPGSVQEFQTAVGDRVFFQMDQVTLTAEAQDTLRKQANWLSQYPDVQIQIEGHADERGSAEYNIALAERRARAVERSLRLQGAGAEQLQIVSYGEEKPAAAGHEEAAWQQNRRVEIVYSGH